MMRMSLAALVGGIVLFFWGAFVHMVLPLSEAAVKQLPNEQVVMDSLAANTQERGVYMFPGIDLRQSPSDAEMAAWETKVRNGPSGLLVYRPNGGDPSMGGKLLKQFISCLLSAFVVVLVLRTLRFNGSYAACVTAITGFGVVAWLSVSIPQWNWYEFTTPFLLLDLADQFGWFVAGLAMAAIVRRRPAY